MLQNQASRGSPGIAVARGFLRPRLAAPRDGLCLLAGSRVAPSGSSAVFAGLSAPPVQIRSVPPHCENEFLPPVRTRNVTSKTSQVRTAAPSNHRPSLGPPIHSFCLQKLTSQTHSSMSVQQAPTTARSLYRSLYRELSRQHIVASQIHLKKDRDRAEALRKYQQMKAAAAGQSASALPPIEDPKAPRYASDALRQHFVSRPAELQGSTQRYVESALSFLSSQRQYNYLLEYYNGSTIDEEKRIELSARRVGLALPDEPKK